VDEVAPHEFTPYEIALLCGGPVRVAQCALLGPHEQRHRNLEAGNLSDDKYTGGGYGGGY
jgi:hypothetical protein